MAAYPFRILLALGICYHPAPAGSAADTDLHGDPLPQGAVARFGTARLRAVCESIHFSADGKTLIGVDNGRLVRVWDAADGKFRESRRLPGRPKAEPWSVRSVRSTDGKTLLIAEPTAFEMRDLESGKRLEVALPSGGKRIDRFAFSDDRRLILFSEVTGSIEFRQDRNFGRLVSILNLVLWDTTTGKQRVLDKDQHSLVALAVSPDGKRVASSSFTSKGTRVWEASTGKEIWSEPRYNAEKMAFTPDGKHLITAPGGGQASWHVWDAATGKAAKGLRAPDVGYAWMFTLSPDGGRLAIPTSTDYVLWDLKAGKALHRWPGARQGGKVAFAPDGRSVLAYDWVLRRWDAATGKPMYADVSALGHTAAVTRQFFAPDGRHLATVGEDSAVRVWDASTSKPVRTLDLGGAKPLAWAMTPDGATLLGLDERWAVHEWSLADGKPRKGYELTAARKLGIGLRPQYAHVGSNGKTLAISGWPTSPEYQYRKYSFSFWDLGTGHLQRWGGDPGNEYDGHHGSLSPDGRWAPVRGELYNTRTGKRQLSLASEGQGRVHDYHLFSPDGRLVAARTKGARVWPDGRLVAARTKGVRVWEVATGRTVADLPDALMDRAAFSPDGRFFARAENERLVVRDLMTGKAVVERAAPEELGTRSHWVTGGVAFSPDGRTVATGHPDGTILLWAMPSPKPEKEPAASDSAAVWQALGDEDPARAYEVVWRLSRQPDVAVRLIEKGFTLAPLPTEQEWRALLRDLDSGRFKEREAATNRLAALGKAAEERLRLALKDNPTREQRRRIDALLSALEPTDRPRGEQLAGIRAVAVLEHVNTPRAREVLQEWGKSRVDARLAEEASRALERMKWRTR